MRNFTLFVVFMILLTSLSFLGRENAKMRSKLAYWECELFQSSQHHRCRLSSP
jgi:hypothetical protein